MKPNSNIIKVLLLGTLLSHTALMACPGCLGIYYPILDTATLIDEEHKVLEEHVAKYHKDHIMPLLEDIESLQNQIAMVSVHMKALEKEANVQDKKLLFMLKKNLKLHTIPSGDAL